MTPQELRSTLSAFKELTTLLTQSNRSLFNLYWKFLCEYLKDRDSVNFSELEIFDEFFPKFTEKIRRYGTTRAEDIHETYLSMQDPYVDILHSIEGPRPDTLYLKLSHPRPETPLKTRIPFGRFEMPTNKFNLLDVILSDTKTILDFEQKYNYFKEYVFSYLVCRTEHFETFLNLISEEDLEILCQKYPEYTQRFEKEAHDFIASLGYYDASEALLALEEEERAELSKLSTDVANQIICINIAGRIVTVEHDNA